MLILRFAAIIQIVFWSLSAVKVVISTTSKATNRYLDMAAGIAVNALGYGRKDLAQIMSRQAEKIIHCSNLYSTVPTLTLAQKLTAASGFDAVFFGNSGTEANEAALKFARIYSKNLDERQARFRSPPTKSIKNPIGRFYPNVTRRRSTTQKRLNPSSMSRLPPSSSNRFKAKAESMS